MSTDPQDAARALPDYTIGREVGRGEFGVVWAGRHRQLAREVAIKQLAGPATATAESASRFRREARILAQINHPHVVTIYDYREDGDVRFLVMELLTGGTLSDRRSAGISIEATVASTLAAASGLHHAHEHGILHRDVKPENLMFDGHNTLKVTDFGIARGDLLDATAIKLTRAGEFFGTPAYVSPEQAGHALAEGWPAIGPASDQYSLSAVLYEGLSGHLTHDSSGGAVALCSRRMNEAARPLGDVAPAVPAELEVVVMRALARDPNDRYPTMEAFAVALAAAATNTLGADWLARSEIPIRDAAPILTAALTAPRRPPEPAAPVPGRPRRKAGRLIAGFVAALIVALASFVVFTQHDSKSGGPASLAHPTGTTRLPLRLTKEWASATGGDLFSSAAVSGDLAVVGSNDGSVYGFELATGATRWKQPTGGPVRSSPTISNGRVYVGSNDGDLYSLDLATGAVIWQAPIGYEIVSSPTVSAGTVVVGADLLYAFDAETGAARWTFRPGDVIVSSPAVNDGTIVVGSNDHSIYGVALSDGTQRWRYQAGDAIQSSPAIAAGVAYMGGLDGKVYALDVTTGERRWSTDLGAPVKSSPAIAGGNLFVGTDAGRLVSLAVDDGATQWSFDADDRVDSSPVVLQDLVVVGSNNDKVYAVTTSAGTLEGVFTTGGPVLASPRVVGADIVVGSYDGNLYRITGFEPRAG
jgi:serine/threonine-protein kinase